MSVLQQRVFLEIRPPTLLENSPASFERCLHTLTQLRFSGFWSRLKGESETISLEIAAIDTVIHFFVSAPERLTSYLESQIITSYPKARLTKLPADYLEKCHLSNVQIIRLGLAQPYFLPLRTYLESKEVDPLATVLGALSKTPAAEVLAFQIILGHGQSWHISVKSILEAGVKDVEGNVKPHPQSSLLEQKIAQPGYQVALRLLGSGPNPSEITSDLDNLVNSFGSFTHQQSNHIINRGYFSFLKNTAIKAFSDRSLSFKVPHQYLNASEIATLWHLPDAKTSQIKNIAWGNEAFTEAPENLPASLGLNEEDKTKINFFARAEFKNQLTTFGIKDGDDRRRHFYIVGKTGTGKSTLIANMAISDIKRGHGVAVIDPHGDLCEILLNYIPAKRINDVVYLDVSAIGDKSFRLNPFEISDNEQADIIASGIVAIFQKLYATSWGPRLEYILRNTVITLVSHDQATLLDVPKILTDKGFRDKIVEKLTDSVLRNFWQKEYDKFEEKFRQEAIAPILNKVGQFLSSQRIRSILGQPKSTVDLSNVMNEGKILLLNLSQGKVGEDSSSLLGALFITKFQLAAMKRAFIPVEQRRDFFLYVDEFQNFATSSFIKILSEARKYRLDLVLANQYIAQISEDVQKSIFGNVGSLLAFILGAQDAPLISKEFGGTFSEQELVSLKKHQIALKMSIDNTTSIPFLAHTLPLPASSNLNKEKVIRTSMERYYK